MDGLSVKVMFASVITKAASLASNPAVIPATPPTVATEYFESLRANVPLNRGSSGFFMAGSLDDPLISSQKRKLHSGKGSA
ncbi:MAG: hypothetical protein HKN82_01300 [Akkermansiaceae bacterium]|nr:hypothetical protein [Akkermansiaceae bacterium]NNM28276.1 hypothetical protein [Akkermansiaceae bacterium]